MTHPTFDDVVAMAANLEAMELEGRLALIRAQRTILNNLASGGVESSNAPEGRHPETKPACGNSHMLLGNGLKTVCRSSALPARFISPEANPNRYDECNPFPNGRWTV